MVMALKFQLTVLHTKVCLKTTENKVLAQKFFLKTKFANKDGKVSLKIIKLNKELSFITMDQSMKVNFLMKSRAEMVLTTIRTVYKSIQDNFLQVNIMEKEL